MSSYEYLALDGSDLLSLRRERVRLLEVELFRAELQIEEAQSETECRAVLQDAGALRARLAVHYKALGIVRSGEESAIAQSDPTPGDSLNGAGEVSNTG